MQPVLQNVSASSVLLRFVLTSAMGMGVLQAALMVFVLDATILVGVCLPFTIGKSLALLSVSHTTQSAALDMNLISQCSWILAGYCTFYTSRSA